jgi:hypothetical protein
MRAISGAAVFSDAAHIEGGVKILKATYESIKKDAVRLPTARSSSLTTSKKHSGRDPVV